MRSGAVAGAAAQVTMELEVAVAPNKAVAVVAVQPLSQMRATCVTTKLAVVHVCCGKRHGTHLLTIQ